MTRFFGYSCAAAIQNTYDADGDDDDDDDDDDGDDGGGDCGVNEVTLFMGTLLVLGSLAAIVAWVSVACYS